MPSIRRALVWFRRDLRLDDHGPLLAALAEADEVFCCFVFDPDLLDALIDRDDRRVHFMRDSLAELSAGWRRLAAESGTPGGASPIFLRVAPALGIPALATALGVSKVYAGRDYEPAAKVRDAAVGAALERDGRALVLVKDQVIFEADEVLTGAGQPFSVFTPYAKAWKKRLVAQPAPMCPLPRSARRGRLAAVTAGLADSVSGLLSVPVGETAPSLAAIGFQAAVRWPAGVAAGEAAGRASLDRFVAGSLSAYAEARDFPARFATSRLSVHLRFGTVSIRRVVAAALASGDGAVGAEAWLNELIWREFYQTVLDVRPDVVQHCFRREYDRLAWDNRPDLFAAWCEGRTGYPLVDAAMRELLATGFMHNRTRMVAASFLCKDLGIDWRLGEQFFARHLLDYDLAANNGGWQWCASTGCDAQPYFRVFNPVAQSKKFDSEGAYIPRWVPELAGLPARLMHAPWLMSAVEQRGFGVSVGVDYPAPIVDHAEARLRTLARFAALRL